MFTGIVEEIGRVTALERAGDSALLAVACERVLADVQHGDSINVNGVCLTVTAADARGFRADLMRETLDRSALGLLVAGAPVNLERALRADARLGGHLVQGHVDGVGEVLAAEDRGQWTVVTVSLPEALAPYVVEKGSVAIDGTSLTVMTVAADRFSVGLIPHTLAVTVLGTRMVGDRVNLEADVIAKYVERLVRGNVTTPYGGDGS